MVAAVVVLYKPDMLLLDRLLRSVVGQVEKSFVIDNTPGSTADFSSFFDQYQGSISYIPLGENKGIATAQNIGIRQGMDTGCSHVLLLDQDSALPADMVRELLHAENQLVGAGEKVAAVGPLFVDEKTGGFSRAIRHSYLRVHKIVVDQTSERPVETDYVIASGSLIRCVVLNDIGMMRDELFIDWVDIEWGLRAKNLGYKSYIIPNIRMIHSIGDSFVQFMGREINLHGDTRHYYLVRNATFLIRIRHMGSKWRVVTLMKIPQYVVFYSFYSKNRIKSTRLLLRAVLDGASHKLGRLN
jgi:rhamnosyltransferase